MKQVLSFFLYLIILQSCAPPEKHIPYLDEKEDHATFFVVDNKPMLLLAGEPLNSTGSYPVRLHEVLSEMSKANYNTALIAITWQMIEPKENQFNFTYVDDLLQIAKNYNIKIGLLWFGAWKNGISPYAPGWVLSDTKRFQRVRSADGENTQTLSPFYEETRNADTKAFVALMDYIAEKDKDRTIITAQVENEIGVLGQSRDYSEEANKAFAENVPDELIDYLNNHKESLEIELLEKWEENGFKTNGSWTDIFGDNPLTDLFFMAWHYSSYVNHVAEEGKKSYPLPMFANCWMSQKRPQTLVPGNFPSGGPVLQVLDIWKAGAPNIDFLSPDIYDDRTFYIHPNDFHRPDNPLFVPEMHIEEGRATYLVAEHDAMGASPFGLDGHAEILANEYEFLDMMMPIIIENQGTNKMHGFMRWDASDTSAVYKFDEDVTIHVEFNKRTTTNTNRNSGDVRLPPAYGIYIKTTDNEFIIGGLNVYVSATSTNPEKEVWLNNVREGLYNKEGKWEQLGIRNGDEAGFLSFDTPHYSVGKYQGYHQGAVGSTTIPAVFKFEVIKYDKQ